jgi:hypothetical protein
LLCPPHDTAHRARRPPRAAKLVIRPGRAHT